MAVPRTKATGSNFREKLDSGEKAVARQLAEFLCCDAETLLLSITSVKQTICQWLDTYEGPQGPLDSNVFYSWYTAHLHVSSAVLAYEGIKSQAEADGQQAIDRWLYASHSFGTSAIFAFAAVDCACHVAWVLLNPQSALGKIDPNNWNWIGYRYASVQFNQNRPASLQSALGDFIELQPTCGFFDMRQWFRNKTLHETFNYVVPRRSDMLTSDTKDMWAVVRPDLDTERVNKLRELVTNRQGGKRTAWDTAPKDNFLCGVIDGQHGIMPARKVAQAFVQRAVETFKALGTLV